MTKFVVQYTNQPWRNHSFDVRGICKCDVLNPCWDNRKTDIPGRHWGGGLACEPCTKAGECYAGKIKVGGVAWNDFKSRNEVGVDYRYCCYLPGLKAINGAVANKADAIAKVETIVKRWFDLALS